MADPAVHAVKPAPPSSRKDRAALWAYVRYFWRDVVMIVGFAASMWVMELLNRPIGTVHDLSIPLDDKIPLVPWTVIPYNTWGPILIILAITYFFVDRILCRRYVITMLVGQLMADLTFPFFQTKIPRPYATVFGADDIFSKLLAWVYRTDNHYCGFPSIHVTLCTITIFFVWQWKDGKTWLKVLLTLHYLFIMATTVLTKQHVFLDIPGGWLYGLAAIPLSIPLIRWADRKIFGDTYR